MKEYGRNQAKTSAYIKTDKSHGTLVLLLRTKMDRV